MILLYSIPNTTQFITLTYYLRCLTQISFFKNEGFPEPTHSLSRDVTKKELIEKYKI